MMKWLLVFSVVALLSCNNHKDPAGPSCVEPCPDLDYSLMNIENVESSQVYLKYTSSDNGGILPVNSLTSSTVIAGNKSVSLSTRNELFNHYYFYSDPNYKAEIGKFIIKNTQPVYTKLCKLLVRTDDNFKPGESRISLTNISKNDICVKQNLLPTAAFWNLNIPTEGQSLKVSDCGCSVGPYCNVRVLESSPADLYEHIYTYSGKCEKVNEAVNISKVIFINTKSEKINLRNITLR